MIKRINTADLAVGMYVDQVDGSWLLSPMKRSKFRIDSSQDIAKLKKFGITHIFIDTSKGLNIAEGIEPEPIIAPVSLDNTFEVSLDKFRVNRQIPVDIYRLYGGKSEMLFKKGLTYGEEAEEIFRNKKISSVRIPVSQRSQFDKYQNTLDLVDEKKRKEGYDGEFVDPQKVEQYLFITKNYYSVNPILIDPDDSLEFDLFLRENNNLNKVSEKGKRSDIDSFIDWIEKKKSIMIHKDDLGVYKAYLLGRAKNFKKIEEESIRIAYVQENSRILVENLMRSPRSDKLMNETKSAVGDILEVILENPTTFYGLVKINYYDYNTFVHSVNVATMSLALAAGSGITDKADLLDLGLGAILHDVGKSMVDHRVINKPGRLTPDEYSQAKTHVMLGYKMLKENKSISERAMIPLLQHHEKMTGKGYPNGIDGDKIHLFGKISALIDIYDALTVDRVYKKAIGPFDALTIISMAIDDYDKGLFEQLVRMMHSQEA